MYEYTFPTPPMLKDYPSMTEDEARDLAKSFFDFEGIDIVTLDLKLHFRFLAVFHYTGTDKVSGKPVTGWLNGGHLPHLLLDDTEISNPLESLAVFSLSLSGWLNKKGEQSPDGSVPPYRIPPDWKLLCYLSDFARLRIGGMTGYIEWNLISDNQDGITHPDIREKCISRGWIGRQT